MRNAILSAVVIMLAGACWVVAQNASPNRIASPYGISSPPQLKSPAIERPTAPGNGGPNQTLVAPVTQLDLPEIPNAPIKPNDFNLAIPDVPALTPPSPKLVDVKVVGPAPVIPNVEPLELKLPDPIPETPPNLTEEKWAERMRQVNQQLQEPMPVILPTAVETKFAEGPALNAPEHFKLPDLPANIPGLPPDREPPLAPEKIDPLPSSIIPVRLVEKPEPNNDIPPAPITPQPLPVPSMPLPPVKEPIRSATKSALPIIPPLPAVPGVGRDPNGCALAAPPVEYIGEPKILAPNESPAIVPTPNTPYVVDDSNAWSGRLEYDPSCQILGPRTWASADYLMWFMKPHSSPPLLVSVAGSQPGDDVFRSSQISGIYPSSNFDYDPMNGVRGTFGFWLNSAQTVGLEASYFWFNTATMEDSFTSGPGNVIGRPFIDATDGGSTLFSLSPVAGINGAVTVSSSVQVQGGDANLLLGSARVGPQLTMLAGFRYFDMIERLDVCMSMRDTLSDFAAYGNDQFRTHNQFFGGQVGLRWAYEGPLLFASLTGKFAFGAMEESVRISGQTTLSAGVQSISAPGNLLALPTNIGSYQRTRTTFIPELNATIGYRFTSWASAYIGYNFLYVNNLVRPGKQIDTTINPENFPFGPGSPTAFRPTFQFREENFWLQGVNVGVSFRY